MYIQRRRISELERQRDEEAQNVRNLLDWQRLDKAKRRSEGSNTSRIAKET
jgi:hypothetical protein